jgi:hypothetical protein
MALITIDEAKSFLRMSDDSWGDILNPLIETLPSYLQMKTGRAWDSDSTPHPLAVTTCKFILQVWVLGPDQEEYDKLEKTIDNLLGVLTSLGRTLE